MKPQVSIAANVRKSTVVFAEALLAVGVKVRQVRRSFVRESDGMATSSADMIEVKGAGKFSAFLRLNYDLGRFEIDVRSKRGTQMKAFIASHNELQALFDVWNIAKY